MPAVVPIVVGLLVAFFCTLLAVHAVLSRGERGVGASSSRTSPPAEVA